MSKSHSRERLNIMHRRNWVTLLFAVILCFTTAPNELSFGQDTQFAAQRGPYYVGEPVVVQIVASDLSKQDDVKCKLAGELPVGVSIDGPQVGESSSSFMRIVDGRVTRSESVSYRYSFVITSTIAETIDVGPFELTINGETKRIRGQRFRFEKLSPDPKMQIEMSLDSETIYIGQKVPLTVRWAYEGDINEVQYAFSNLKIRSPIFDQFSFQDRRPQTRTTLTLTTANGAVDLDAKVTEETKDGNKVIAVTGTRTLIADSIGEFKDIPISCRTKRATSWGQDFLRGRVARTTAPSLAYGSPMNLTVKPVPTAGRPSSFNGAVGKGFSLEVSANRSVVRVGDPISLLIKLSGDTNLDSISLPELGSQMGLNENDFQLPTEKLSGTIVDNTKEFTVSVRVKNKDIQQIPAMRFSYFDPEKETFTSIESKPIALQVMDTKIVSAADVMSGNATTPPTETDSESSASSDFVSLSGANLAIETNPDRLIATNSEQTWTHWIPWSIYLLGVITSVVVVIRNSKTDASIARSREKNEMAQIRKGIQEAKRLQGNSAYEKLADQLRELVRLKSPSNRNEIESIISECENSIYAPQATEGTAIDVLVAKSLSALANATRTEERS